MAGAVSCCDSSIEGCARSRAADLASPTTVSPWLSAALHFAFSFFFFLSPRCSGEGPKATRLAQFSIVDSLHASVRDLISDKRAAVGEVSLLCSHFPLYISGASCYRSAEAANRRTGPASERTSHLTPSPDLSHVALGRGGGARGARPKPRRTMQLSETFAATGLAAESSFFFFRKGVSAPFYVACSA